MSNQQIWFITGVSGGLGRAIAEEVAQAGHIAIGTLRKDDQATEFTQLHPGNTFGIKMDVDDAASVKQGVEQALYQFGKIDVLVNNAGYGLFGAVEEAAEGEVLAQMETNFMGALRVTQAVLPSMRQNKSGHIMQISSQAGVLASPGLGIYNASKFALEGFSEAMAKEVEPLGIKVTIVEPGPFRTNWAGSSAKRVVARIEDYAPTAWQRIDFINGYSGNQPGDPVKAAQLLLQVAQHPKPPLHLPLGRMAVDAIKAKIAMFQRDLFDWEADAVKTDF
jgi:NAD(P)-dependent dehydrogenase (short-subunit alcohol dehydrogenase family)